MPPKKSVLLSEVTLDDGQLRAIGCVAVESTYLEDVLENVIQTLCVLDEHDFRVFIGGTQISAKLALVSKLTDSRIKQEFVEERNNLFSAISKQITDRNNIIHGIWRVPRLRTKDDPTDPNGFVWVKEGDPYAVRRNRGEAGHTIFEPNEIMATARGLARAASDLHKFLYRSGLYPAPLKRSLLRNVLVIQSRGSASNPTSPDTAKKKGRA